MLNDCTDLEAYMMFPTADMDLLRGTPSYRPTTRPSPGIYTMEYASKFEMVEISPGTRVFVYPYHLQVAFKKGVEQGRDQRNGEKMARYLLGVFWTSKELLGKSLSGVSTTKAQLNPNIIAAITSFCVCNSRHRRGEVRMALASKVSSICSKAKSAQRYSMQLAESRQQALAIANENRPGLQAQASDNGPGIQALVGENRQYPEMLDNRQSIEMTDNQYNTPLADRSPYSTVPTSTHVTSNPYNPPYDLQDPRS